MPSGSSGALNQSMFNAPAVIYICMDKILSEWSLYDIGGICPEHHAYGAGAGSVHDPRNYAGALSGSPPAEMNIPDDFQITIGIAIGYADKDNQINNFKSSRKSVQETVQFFD